MKSRRYENLMRVIVKKKTRAIGSLIEIESAKIRERERKGKDRMKSIVGNPPLSHHISNNTDTN